MMTSGNKDGLIFYQSATGTSHTRKGIPCQDASGAFFSREEAYQIVVVADGHGDSSCMRSDKGSSLAVTATIECLKAFGGYYSEYADIQASYPEKNGERHAIRQLTDSIVCLWTEKVLEDYWSCPLTEEERESAGDFAALYDKGEHLERIYGTTLIAALMTKDYVLLLQQGDGRSDLLYANGDLVQPVPEDERCYANVTTSLSDDDAATGIRSRLIAGKNQDLLACFVGTDGLDNGFYDDSELYAFYLKTTLDLMDCENEDSVSTRLGQSLRDVSINGNGDDVSLAGFVTANATKECMQEMQNMIEERQKEKARDWYSETISSMEDRLAALQEIINNTDSDEQDNAMQEYIALRRRYQLMIDQSELLEQENNDDGR